MYVYYHRKPYEFVLSMIDYHQTTQRVLMPVWYSRYVTLCSNGVMQVHKGAKEYLI